MLGLSVGVLLMVGALMCRATGVVEPGSRQDGVISLSIAALGLLGLVGVAVLSLELRRQGVYGPVAGQRPLD
jgi:hypothetical protein